MTSGGAGAPYRLILAPAGALVSVLAIYAGNEPGPLSSRLHGTSVSAVIVFVALTAGGLLVLRTTSGSAWRWAAGIGIVLAAAQLAGLSLRRFDSLVDPLLAPDNLGWAVVHWLGIAWLTTCGLAALIGALDTHDLRSVSAAVSKGGGRPRPFARLVASLRAPDHARRRLGLLIVMGILVLSRVPFLVVYWPGILHFDTLRSYSYARGTHSWQTYEPVGHSLLIAVMQWLGSALGWGDAGGVAIGSITVILVSSAAFTFMLSRMAVWGLHPGIWAAALAWLVLLPVFGYFSVGLVKDMPFSIAMIVFLVCVGELAFGRPDTAKKRWPWVTLTVAGIFALLLRNNGIHVMALSLPVLLILLRHLWRRILVVGAALGVAYGIYVGPVYAMLDVQPGPQEESYSVPLQQLGRIVKYHRVDLSTADLEFITRTFAQVPPQVLADGYVPYLADPMKLTARRAWGDHSTTELLAGWARIAVTYPRTAIEATLANTVGYWDPEGPSYDGLTRWSANDAPARGIHLDIPAGKPTTGLAAKIESSGIMPTKTYRQGLHDDGYRAIPVLGLAMSPGPVCWLWLIAALLVIRRRDRTALAVFVPAGVLLLSFLAGPVSGGQRYSLTLFMALPLAAAAVVLAKRPGGERPVVGRTTVNDARDQVRSQPAPPDRTDDRIPGVPSDRPRRALPVSEEHAITSALRPRGADSINDGERARRRDGRLPSGHTK